LFSSLLVKLYPDYKPILTVYIDKTPTEVTDAATAALRKEIHHLLQECQLYNLRLLRIDAKLVFDDDTPFEKNLKRKFSLDDLYDYIKRLHAEIFTYYSEIQSHKLNESEAKELERMVFASRNIMNALKNFKGMRQNMDEFDGSDNPYNNAQYKLFRKRLLELYHNMIRIQQSDDREEQYRSLLASFGHIEDADNLFIKNISKAVREQNVQEIEIASLLLVNRLFTQSCRMQIYCLKDLLLSQEQITSFDRALDMKVSIDAERVVSRANPEF
jgi:phosphate:Na+ symporter